MSGNSSMYVSENYYLRLVVVTTAAVTKFVGTGSTGSVDGTGTAASVNEPRGMTVAFAADTFLVAQSGGSVVRMVTTPGAVVTTIAGDGTPGYVDGVGNVAAFDTRIVGESGSAPLVTSHISRRSH